MSIIALGKEHDRSSCRSGYTFAQARGEDSDGKAALRQRVADFMMRFLQTDRQQTLLTMPGVAWEFERAMTARLRLPRFVCCERSWPICEQSAVHMPGDRLYRIEEELKGERLYGFQTTRARILCCSLSAFVSGHGRGSPRPERRNWRDRWRNATAVWIDLTGPLGEESLLSLPRIQACTHFETRRPIPVVVTYMVGRETEVTMSAIEAHGGRDKWCFALAASSHYGKWFFDHSERHKGTGGVTMETTFMTLEQTSFATGSQDPRGFLDSY